MAPRLSTAVAGARPRKLCSTERRAAIIDVAREVFCETGLSGARIRTIAERAGISEPLLYRHFESRDQLYREAVEEHLARLIDDAIADARRVETRTDLDQRQMMRVLTRAYVELMDDIAPLASVALYEDHSRGKQLYQQVVRPGQREVAAILYRAVTGRDLVSGAENVLAVTLLGIPFGVALDGMPRGCPVALDEMVERIVTLFETPI